MTNKAQSGKAQDPADVLVPGYRKATADEPGWQCQDCGTRHPHNIRKDWGRLQETVGYGPRPVCVELVENPHAPPAQAETGGVRYVVDEPVLQVCMGELFPTTHPAGEPVKTFSPINPFKR